MKKYAKKGSFDAKLVVLAALKAIKVLENKANGPLIFHKLNLSLNETQFASSFFMFSPENKEESHIFLKQKNNPSIHKAM